MSFLIGGFLTLDLEDFKLQVYLNHLRTEDDIIIKDEKSNITIAILENLPFFKGTKNYFAF